MKQFFLSAALASITLFATAQDLKKVSTAYLLGKKEEAKTQIDILTADPKFQSNPSVWYWQSTIYGALYDDTTLRKKHPEALETAMVAYHKYVELDPSFKIMTEAEPLPGKQFINSLYAGNFNKALNAFQSKQWDSAFKYFSRSAEIGDLIVDKNWGANKQGLDTVTILFSGYAAQNAKKEDDAVKYYSRLADKRVTKYGTVGEVKDLYQYLISYYSNKKNSANFNKYLTIAKELFPEDKNTWIDWEIDFMENNASLAEKTEAYDKADAAGTLTTNQYLAYGNMFYNIKDEEKEKLDSAQIVAYRNKAENAFIKGYSKDNTNGIAAFNAGLINYNDWVTLDDQFETNRKKIIELNKSKAAEKDPKKKAANDAKINKQVNEIKAESTKIEKQQHEFADKAIKWMETAYATFSAKANLERIEKSIAGKSVDDLANLYLWKRDKAKGNATEYDKYDALYKKYDALHDKY